MKLKRGGVSIERTRVSWPNAGVRFERNSQSIWIFLDIVEFYIYIYICLNISNDETLGPQLALG